MFMAATAALAVASALTLAAGYTDPCESGEATPFPGNHDVWAQVLSAHVSRGTLAGIDSTLVDYDAVRASPAQLRSYLASLCNVDLSSMSADERLALWLNAYNSVMMMMIVHFNPPESVKQISDIVNGQVWDYKFATVASMKVSPGDIEHVHIRGADDMSGSTSSSGWNGAAAQVSPTAAGRVHSGMVCASLSCPDLPLVPYEGATIQEQLDATTRAWVGNPTKNHGPSNGGLLINSVFSWFSADFARESGSIQSFLATYAPASWNVVGSEPISYMEYNWALNSKTGTGVFIAEGEEAWYEKTWVQATLAAAGAVVFVVVVGIAVRCVLKRRGKPEAREANVKEQP